TALPKKYRLLPRSLLFARRRGARTREQPLFRNQGRWGKPPTQKPTNLPANEGHRGKERARQPIGIYYRSPISFRPQAAKCRLRRPVVRSGSPRASSRWGLVDGRALAEHVPSDARRESNTLTNRPSDAAGGPAPFRSPSRPRSKETQRFAQG